jgi:hypothetical protein
MKLTPSHTIIPDFGFPTSPVFQLVAEKVVISSFKETSSIGFLQRIFFSEKDSLTRCGKGKEDRERVKIDFEVFAKKKERNKFHLI